MMSKISDLPADVFEEKVVPLFFTHYETGWDCWLTKSWGPGPGDFGIDLYLKMPTGREAIAEVKSNTADVGVIREAYGAKEGDWEYLVPNDDLSPEILYIVAPKFTRDAREWVEEYGGTVDIRLIDGDDIIDVFDDENLWNEFERRTGREPIRR